MSAGLSGSTLLAVLAPVAITVSRNVSDWASTPWLWASTSLELVFPPILLVPPGVASTVMASNPRMRLS